MTIDFYAEVFKTLGHPLRLRLAIRLLTMECHVVKLAEEFGVSQPSISQHLRVLRDAGVVEGKRQGNLYCHVVVDERIKKILSSLK